MRRCLRHRVRGDYHGDNPYKADDFPIQVAKRDQVLPVIAL